MRKLFIFLGAFIAALVLFFVLLPLFSGMIAENKFKQVVSEIAAFSDINIKVVEYRRHWFSSDAKVVIDLSSQTTLPLDSVKLDHLMRSVKLKQITLMAHMMHGPVVITQRSVKLAQAMIDADLFLNDEQSALLQRVKGDPSLVTMRMGISLTGKSTIHINSPKFLYRAEQHIVKWQEIDLLLELSPTLQNIKRTIAIPSMELDAPNFSLRLAGFMTTYAGEKYADGLWIGDSMFMVRHFALNISTALEIIFDNLRMTSNFKVAKGLVSGNSHVVLQNCIVNGKKFTNNVLVWSVDKFKVNVLAQIENEIDILEESSSATPPMQKFARLLSLLGNLLSDGATVVINKLDLNTPWGLFMADGSVIFPGSAAGGDNVQSLVSNFTEELNLKMEKKLTAQLLEVVFSYLDRHKRGSVDDYKAQVVSLLRDLEKTQALVSENNFYKLRVSYKNNKLLLNDKPFTITQS